MRRALRGSRDARDVRLGESEQSLMPASASIARSGGVNHMKINIVNNLCMQNEGVIAR